MQIKTTVRYHYAPIRATKIKKRLTISKVSEDEEELQFSYNGGVLNGTLLCKRVTLFFKINMHLQS